MSRLPRDIAVDLDGTLIMTDSLDEGLAKALLRVPHKAWMFPLYLMKGRAALKEKAKHWSAEGIAHMPVRHDLVEWLKAQRAGGRKVHLVTAADRAVADAAAYHIGIFDSVIATENGVNLKGSHKRDRLESEFPEGFAYAGDSRADIPVFKAAESIVLAGASPSVAEAARKLGKPVEAEFCDRPGGGKSAFSLWRKALRMHQWSKNLILFIPLMLGGGLSDAGAVLAAVLGFLLMGVVASATYIINDLSDLSSDRQHETKRERPFASGALSVRSGLLMAGFLLACGFPGAIWLSPAFAGLLGVYTVTTLGYSYSFKRVPMLDVTVLAFLYFMRLAVGATLAAAPLSPWLAAFALFFFYSLSLAKRHTEIVKKARSGSDVIGRGYQASDAVLTLPIGVAAAACSILIMVLFLVFDASTRPEVYAAPHFLWPAPAIIALWVQRVWLLSARGELEDDPVSFAVKDKMSLGLGALLFAFTLLAVFGLPPLALP
jgi:4-hydroxybenzoate polyprenyltransferase/phosphoserine phosphatase